MTKTATNNRFAAMLAPPLADRTCQGTPFMAVKLWTGNGVAPLPLQTIEKNNAGGFCLSERGVILCGAVKVYPGVNVFKYLQTFINDSSEMALAQKQYKTYSAKVLINKAEFLEMYMVVA